MSSAGRFSHQPCLCGVACRFGRFADEGCGLEGVYKPVEPAGVAEPFGHAGIESAEVEPAVNLREAFGVAGGHFEERRAQGGAAPQAQHHCWRVGSGGVGQPGLQGA